MTSENGLPEPGPLPEEALRLALAIQDWAVRRGVGFAAGLGAAAARTAAPGAWPPRAGADQRSASPTESRPDSAWLPEDSFDVTDWPTTDPRAWAAAGAAFPGGSAGGVPTGPGAGTGGPGSPWAGFAGSQFPSADPSWWATHLATDSAECRICPLCRAIAALRAMRPEVYEHLLAASVALTAALRAALDAHEREWARRPGDVERIRIDLDERTPATDPGPAGRAEAEPGRSTAAAHGSGATPQNWRTPSDRPEAATYSPPAGAAGRREERIDIG